jgi:hypothetical protein
MIPRTSLSPLRASLISVSFCASLASLTCACDKPAPPSTEPPASASSPAPSHAATPSVSSAASAAPITSPSATAHTDTNALTPERRAKIEAAIPDAKDFVDARDLGKEVAGKPDFLKAWQELVGKKAPGKWILFRGAMNDLKKDTFAVAVTMMEVDPNSPIGAPKWIMFHAKDVKGYDASKYEAGAYGAVLAKYVGGKANELRPGFDVVALGYW